MPRNSLSASYLPRRPESAIGFPKCWISKHVKLSKMRQFNSFSFRVECTYASIRLEMSDSPPTPAAGPPTAFDIIPDILTTQRHSDSESKRVIKPNLKATPPPLTCNQLFLALTAVVLVGSASRSRPVNKNPSWNPLCSLTNVLKKDNFVIIYCCWHWTAVWFRCALSLLL